MGRAAALADHLPSLWRPGPDGVGPTLRLTAADVAEIVPVPGRRGVPTPTIEVTDLAVGVLVTFGRPTWPRRIRLRPGAAPGTAAVLELRRIVDDQPTTLAHAVVAVRDGVVDVPHAPSLDRVALLLRRRHLLDRWLQAVGAALDDVGERASEVMQSHWVDTADAALLSPVVLRGRHLAGRPPPDRRDPDDRRELDDWPHLRDLARLGALVPVAPWREPPAIRDVVESYRLRVHRTIALHRQGLGTVPALRRGVELQLPVDPTAPPEHRDVPFTVEEFAPVVDREHVVTAAGPPAEVVGPLMHWQVDNDGLTDAAPTVHVRGVTPIEGALDATIAPVVELTAAGERRRRIALGFRGTVPPGITLRYTPTCSTWLLRDDGLHVTAPPAATDAGIRGPWAPVDDAPTGVVALVWTADLAVWAATVADGGASLWRHDGRTWDEALVGLPPVTCLAPVGDVLLVGTEVGLLRVVLHPADGSGPAPQPDPATLDGPAVRTLLPDADGSVLIGGDDGLVQQQPDGTHELLAPDGDPAVLGAVRALARDATGTLHVGSDTGLFTLQPRLGHWYAFAGEGVTETVADWVRVGRADDVPADPGLPPVRAVLRGPDGALWIGTDVGLARYVARPTRGTALAYSTVLEAFPDLVTEPVNAIVEDVRGLVWIATDRGLLRTDGRDLAQVAGDGHVERLGRVDEITPTDGEPQPRGTWRFDRAGGAWQRWVANGWRTTSPEPRTGEQPGVHAVLVTDGVDAVLVEGWDPATGATGTTTPIDQADLVVRVKPGDDTRVVDGGVPALPRVPAGPSTWRYLALEPEDVAEPVARPAWTVEGRLLPPPPDRGPPGVGRYDAPEPTRRFDGAVFGFLPAAQVWMRWRARRPLTVLVRLDGTAPVDPAVLDRVWDGIGLVRPAGVSAALAVGSDIVRGGT